MPEIILHDVDPALAQRLADRAATSGRSVEDEAKLLLESSVGLTRNRAMEAARELRARSGARHLGDSAALIREDRDR
jgi:plasmid stability protein